MTCLNISLICLIIILSLFWNKFSLINVCDIDKCPYCFGKDFCNEYYDNKLTLKKDSFVNIFNNYFGVKNVYYARYNNLDVIIKKLAHNFEFTKLDELICKNINLSVDCNLNKLHDSQNYRLKIVDFLTKYNSNSVSNFKICTKSAVEEFVHLLLNNTVETDFLKNVWTILQVNVEPILLQLLKDEDKWPVPKYLGACGRTIIENDCGSHLNSYENSNWTVRVILALQLLKGAKDFTDKHINFRFYLTDISPDNIAIDSNLQVTFIDLENVIITSKNNSGTIRHYSSDFTEDEYSFSETEICGSSLSDHNYFAVCKLLLSENAPWPMMNGGLLHSSPEYITKSYPQLFKYIRTCLNPTDNMNRFEAVEALIHLLEQLT